VRIIAGEFRGRRIDAPPGLSTRPMLDRVREAMCSTLHDRFPDAQVLDLFAGSGSLGLEALSRGARHVRFVERGAPALAALKKNIDTLCVRDRAEVVVADALKPSSWIPAADIVFLDPPYAMLDGERSRVLGALTELVGTHITADGIVVLHTPRGALAETEMTAGDSHVRRYGTNDLWYVQHPAAR
jgi:16S rRNA (guanine966-N2)-methyltransferase